MLGARKKPRALRGLRDQPFTASGNNACGKF
ncbi:hypothetical protein CNECB9_4480002 [Cupriavidus necator]|uniref:Uncharacterized protein n=1 Tax=Cupriavidus necator TaxID=106590 RepID=A0A1K0JTF0_CUPNE|nr:hypothetical protein CNECB9_4480002 [Cupriavidus necator]